MTLSATNLKTWVLLACAVAFSQIPAQLPVMVSEVSAPAQLAQMDDEDSPEAPDEVQIDDADTPDEKDAEMEDGVESPRVEHAPKKGKPQPEPEPDPLGGYSPYFNPQDIPGGDDY